MRDFGDLIPLQWEANEIMMRFDQYWFHGWGFCIWNRFVFKVESLIL